MSNQEKTMLEQAEQIAASAENDVIEAEWDKAYKENLTEICRKTGWDWADAEAHLEKAKEKGIPNFRYIPYECWKMDDNQLTLLGTKAKQIKAICKVTGWNWDTTEKGLDAAKKLGVPNFRYMPYECWKLTDDELKRLGQKCKYIIAVRRATAWKWEQIEDRLDRAEQVGLPPSQYVKAKGWLLTEEEILLLGRSVQQTPAQPEQLTAADLDEEQRAKLSRALQLRISEKTFLSKNLWDLNDEELEEYARVAEERKEQVRKDREYYISVICEKTGWSRPETELALEEARKMGIPPIRYVQKEVWTKNEDEVDFLVRFLKKNSKRVTGQNHGYLEKICEATGWSIGKAELEVAKAKLVSEASYEDYFVFKMYSLPPEEQSRYVTYGLFSKMRMKYNSLVPARAYFDDKAVFNRTFSDHIKRRWFVNRNLSYENFLKKTDGLDAVFAKLLTATQGIGAQKFSCNVEDKKRLYDEIMALPDSIVEEYIVQHPAVMEFCDTSVNTLRITTLNAHGKCNFLYAVFRMGQGKEVDNFHAGGIAATVDCKTGIVATHAADLDANVYPVNPYSGMAVKGFKIPHWDKVIETCLSVYDRVPGVNLIGWDFAITPDGVDLVEGNPGASYVVAQIPRVQEKIGLRSEMVDPYL